MPCFLRFTAPISFCQARPLSTSSHPRSARMRLNLRGKKVLVTGASSGIGLATARALAKKGATLAISGRRLEALEELARQIVADGGERPVVLTADLSQPGE